MPGQSITDVNKKYPKKELVFKSEQFKTHKYYIKHLRYKFPILVQSYKEIITDFHARLPQYFLHDIFHQGLINRLGKQDIYKKVEEQAVYIWINKDNNRHYYAGACSITCFPIYYAVRNLGQKLPEDYKPLINKFKLKNIIIENSGEN